MFASDIYTSIHLKKQGAFTLYHIVYTLFLLKLSYFLNIINMNVARIITKNVRPIIFESGHIANATNGSCVATIGDTSVLTTLVSSKADKPSSFLPLTVEYREEAAAAGRIPTTHLRRERGSTEKDILTSRNIDRSVRSTFPKYFFNQTNLICSVLSIDGINNPDIAAINSASASIAISDVPWEGPVAAVRLATIDGKTIVFPTRKQVNMSSSNIVMTTNHLGNLVMIDASFSKPTIHADISEMLKYGTEECAKIIEAIQDLQSQIGKTKQPIDESLIPSNELLEFIRQKAEIGISKVLVNCSLDKYEKDKAIEAIQKETFEQLTESSIETSFAMFNLSFQKIVKDTHRQLLRKRKRRIDGRLFDQVRKISCNVDVHKPLHGSSIFKRGMTQVFCSCTFDSLDAAFPTDQITLLTTGVKEKNFMLHYEFPQFATGMLQKGSGPDRREIGHGSLAEKSLRAVIPSDSEFTIRLKCKVLDSNGSSSMASVCAGSMALMDAGVNIKRHVAGLATGLFCYEATENEPEEEILLTDILGFEDYAGDMDLKIAGTTSAITAIHLDVKPVEGVKLKTIESALAQSGRSRQHVIDIMKGVIRTPRKEKKSSHPVTKTLHVPANKRFNFLGFNGTNLKKMMREHGVKITEYISDSENPSYDEPNFMIFAPNQEAMSDAEEAIEELLKAKNKVPDLKFGDIYSATIVDVKKEGLMVVLYPTMRPALLPLREVDIKYVHDIMVFGFKIGDKIQIKYFGTDPVSGSMRISRRVLQMTAPRKHDHNKEQVDG